MIAEAKISPLVCHLQPGKNRKANGVIHAETQTPKSGSQGGERPSLSSKVPELEVLRLKEREDECPRSNK